MKTKTTAKNCSLNFIKIALLILIPIIISSCRKDFTENPTETMSPEKITNNNERLGKDKKVNPFSIKNIRKAKKALAKRNKPNGRIASASSTNDDPDPVPITELTYFYCSINPNSLTTEQFLALENDEAIHLMNFPFADGEIYDESYAFDQTKAEALRDGNVYAVIPTSDPATGNWAISGIIQQGIQDTLVEPGEMDTALQFQALREAGVDEQQIAAVCLFKKPHGFVRYQDDQLNRLEPVRTMQVWSIAFGIPKVAYTDANGYYEIPWRYSIGTIMGTKAKNSRVTVKPLDTHGSLIQNLVTIQNQFIVGSIHVDGWVSPCQMRDGKDFNFTGHTQVRYWSQILNAYYFHDLYCDSLDILKAPNRMICYAAWTNTTNVDQSGVPNFRAAGTPLAGHVNYVQALGEAIINNVFEAEVDVANNNPQLFNLLLALLPDMYISVPEAAQPTSYNSRLAQTLFHELAHASQYRQVGNAWYAALQWAEGWEHDVPGNPYGNNDYPNSGYVQIAESWAEFLGANFALRRYPAGLMRATHTTGSFAAGDYVRINNILENQGFFFEGTWLPMGIFHDLMDDTNVAPNNPGETWDRVQGVSIHDMYYAFTPQINSICDYEEWFTFQNSGLNAADVHEIFVRHSVNCN